MSKANARDLVKYLPEDVLDKEVKALVKDNLNREIKDTIQEILYEELDEEISKQIKVVARTKVFKDMIKKEVLKRTVEYMKTATVYVDVGQ